MIYLSGAQISAGAYNYISPFSQDIFGLQGAAKISVVRYMIVATPQKAKNEISCLPMTYAYASSIPSLNQREDDDWKLATSINASSSA